MGDVSTGPRAYVEGRMAARTSGWVSERTPVLLACAFRWTAVLFHKEKKKQNKTEKVFSFERMGRSGV